MNVQGISPKIMAPVIAQSANQLNATANASSTSGSSSSSSSTSTSNLEGTFLNLLVTELQNQDPTSPVDPTQMVSQMVSLNQLDQLIAIHQTLTGMSSGSSSSNNTSGTAQAQVQAKANSSTTSAKSSIALPNASTSQIPTSYTGSAGNSGLMNLYGSYGLPNSTSISNQTGVR
jgi:flagellar basal-body rod modification protein FlgD